MHDVAASESSPLFIVAQWYFGNVSFVYLWVMGRSYLILCIMAPDVRTVNPADVGECG